MNLKKPKFWDYKKPNIYAYLLYPLAILIKFFSYLKKDTKQRVEIKTICVGNIYLGGTGKTSLCVKINEILKKKNIKSCFVKKYYRNQIDEQKLLEANGKLFMSDKRIEAVLQAKKANYDIVILDDGLQDQSIDYDASIVCFNTINWIGNGMTIPSGPLRENINNIKKYKYLFLNGNLENLEFLKKEILKINPNIIIFIGEYQPTNIGEFDKNDNYLVFSGIGNHKTFVSMLKKKGFKIIKEIEYADHYKYTIKDIKKIIEIADKLKSKILTTEKDFIRLGFDEPNKIKFIKSELQIVDEENFINSII